LNRRLPPAIQPRDTATLPPMPPNRFQWQPSQSFSSWLSFLIRNPNPVPASPLGRKERIEDLVADLGRNPWPIISNGHPQSTSA
jgi:hypothetical protein